MTLPVAGSMFSFNTEPTHLESFFFLFFSSCFTKSRSHHHQFYYCKICFDGAWGPEAACQRVGS